MLTDSPTLVSALREWRILDGVAAEAALAQVSATFPDSIALADELVRLGWLTAFQSERLQAGHAADLILGQYVLLEKLGEGGMGAVYKARHRVLKAIRAIKVIRPDRLTNAQAVSRFYLEAEMVGKLRHPNIILPHDAGQVGDVHFLAMEYISGADLSRLLETRGPLPAGEACEYIRQGAAALQHAHERGLVHRDIKPANLLVSSADGQVKLLDLGLARLRASAEERGPVTALTEAGAMMGTPDYMAPEQAEDSHAADVRADIYSLGCTFYHILTGRPPFPGGSVMEKLIKHRLEEPRPVEALRPDLPAGLGPVLRKMMAKERGDRFQTPGAAATALRPFCTMSHRPPPPRSGAHPAAPAPPLAKKPSTADMPQSLSASHFQSAKSLTFARKPAEATQRQPTSPNATHKLRGPANATQRMPVTARPGARLRGLLALLALVVAGAVIGGGGRYLLLGDSPAKTVVPPSLAITSPIETQPPAPIQAAATEKTVPASESHGEPTPAPTGPSSGKGRGNPRVSLAECREWKDEPKSAGRPATWSRRETLHWLREGRAGKVAFAADGSRALVANDSTVWVFDMAQRGATPREVALKDLTVDATAKPAAPGAIALSADGQIAYLATAGPSLKPRGGHPEATNFNLLVQWVIGNSTTCTFGPPTLQGSRPDVRHLVVSLDGRDAIGAGTLPDAIRWDLQDGRPPRPFKHGDGAEIYGLALSADGKRLLTAGRDHLLYLHDLAAPDAAPLRLRGHQKSARCAAFSADGHYVVSGDDDHKVLVWDVSASSAPEGALAPVQQLVWHAGAVTAVAFAPAGHTFLAAGDDGQLCLGEVLQTEPQWRERPEGLSTTRLLAIAFSADGQHVVYATERWLGRYPVRPLTEGAARLPRRSPRVAPAVAWPEPTR